jgi:hypothetical protein
VIAWKVAFRVRRIVPVAGLALALVGCSRPVARASVPLSHHEPSVLVSDAVADTRAPLDASRAEDAVADAGAPSDAAPRLTRAQASEILFLADPTLPTACETGDDARRIECLIATRFAADAAAARLAQDLYRRTGDITGLSAAETMEGGWRGTLHLVPALPIGKERTHLEWVVEATRDYDAFFEGLTSSETEAPRYVWRGVAFRFMRSVGARTPSAYALLRSPLASQDAGTPIEWTIAYNVDGSLNKSADAVRELLFHENFHLNDENHGDWSVRALGATFDSIVARCGTRMGCLTPFAPTEMTVRGGTYYAFHPNNGCCRSRVRRRACPPLLPRAASLCEGSAPSEALQVRTEGERSVLEAPRRRIFRRRRPHPCVRGESPFSSQVDRQQASWFRRYTPWYCAMW